MFQCAQHLLRVCQELFKSKFEGLITGSEYEPNSIIPNLLDSLLALLTIVMYTCHLQPLLELQTLLK
ncbi:hypothetical protein PtB15_6B426 [Puccinia triticina]|nr:hypothetical protein PtB15_6B426 [Puccinia triticina]